MGVEPSMFDVKYKGLSTEEAMRQAERDKLLYAQKEALQEQNRLFQQQLQMQQQALEHQQEAERQRRIAENNAEIERLTNMLREHCRAVGIDYDYMINFYENCYRDKEETEEILIMKEEINKFNNLQEAIDIKNELKDYEKAEKVSLFIIFPLLLIIPCVALGSFFQGNLWLGVLEVIIVLFLIFINKKILPNAEKREKFNNKRFRRNDIIRKYHVHRFQTKEYYNNKINELQEIINNKNDQANITSRKCQKEFDEFRRNHYNKEIELLFKNLEIGFNKVAPSEAKGTGTIAEYDEYIKDKILEN